MAIYSSFLGQNDGYTKAQQTGLRRSAGIKKKRKEEERAFEKAQEREKGERALTGRRMIETGATRRTAMTEAGATGREKMSNIGMMARQRLVGEQGVEAATVGATRAANIASMKHARGLTTADIKHGRDVELAKITAKDPFADEFKTPGGAVRAGLAGEGKASKSVLTDFLDMDDSGKKAYIDRLKKEDPDAFLSLAKQYKMWSAPKPEASGTSARMNLGSSPIYQSDSGTYRNF